MPYIARRNPIGSLLTIRSSVPLDNIERVCRSICLYITRRVRHYDVKIRSADCVKECGVRGRQSQSDNSQNWVTLNRDLRSGHLSGIERWFWRHVYRIIGEVDFDFENPS